MTPSVISLTSWSLVHLSSSRPAITSASTVCQNCVAALLTALERCEVAIKVSIDAPPSPSGVVATASVRARLRLPLDDAMLAA